MGIRVNVRVGIAVMVVKRSASGRRPVGEWSVSSVSVCEQSPSAHRVVAEWSSSCHPAVAEWSPSRRRPLGRKEVVGAAASTSLRPKRPVVRWSQSGCNVVAKQSFKRLQANAG